VVIATVRHVDALQAQAPINMIAGTLSNAIPNLDLLIDIATLLMNNDAKKHSPLLLSLNR
jgi:hypothetical protein